MKLFVCGSCGHVEFDQAPDRCLVCRSPATSFAEDEAAIKTPANPGALTDGDKKHIPQIVVVKECGLLPGGGCTDVHVRVGEIEHVMQEKHYITSLDYYLNHKFISRTWLSPLVCHPAAALHLNATSGIVTVVEHCNVHGNWMSETAI
jgi:desulfoferrodoxin-like iron-binding protein